MGKHETGNWDRATPANAGHVTNGFHIFRDGNSWVAVGPSFFDLEASIAGFGGTPEQAYEEWFKRRRQDVGTAAEPFSAFKIAA